MADLALNESAKLLDAFSRVKRPPTCEQTILEIAGYAHYEIVASNLLKFFLQPKQNHGLKTAVLGSLLAANGEIVSDSDLEEVEVRREVHTDAGKSIDLLIETASLVIAVENKLFAKPYNDFDEYARFTQSIARDSSKKAILILLTLNTIDIELHLAGFNPVTYEHFIDLLLHKISPVPTTANTHYVGYLMDFIRTVQNLVRRPEMFKPIHHFIANNIDKIAHLEGALTKFRGAMDENLENLAQQIKRACDPSLHEVKGPYRFNDSWPERLALCRYWEVVIPKEKKKLAIDVYLTPREWRVFAFRRPNVSISDVLVARGFEPLKHADPDQGPNRSLCFTFPYDTDISEIAVKVQSLVDALRQKKSDVLR